MDEELMFLPALEQARLVRDGEVTARELVEASLDAIERVDCELHAFVHVMADQALAAADAIEPGDERPFAGVPLAVKDLLGMVAGEPLRMGTAAIRDFVPPIDTSTIRRLRETGAIFVGKTATPEFGILPVTEPDAFGATRNPWDTSRTPGGSSGGSAAAVAAGVCAVGYSNDGGGSIRIPASCCGLVGLKPSRGRISGAPTSGELVGGWATEGVVTRTVADTAVALDAMAGYEPGDPYWAPPPSAPFAHALERAPGKLRIAFTTEAPNGVPVDEHCAAAVRDAAELLESLGHEVTEGAADWNEPAYVEHFVKVWIAQAAAQVVALEEVLGDAFDRSKLEPLTQEMIAAAEGTNTTEYLNSLRWLQVFSRGVVGFWNDHDILLTPTLAKPPIEIGALRPAEGEPAIGMLMKAGEWVPFTPAINVTGQPAISLPLAQSPDGLPIGVQLVGPPAGEELLISLSAQIEGARPWAGRRPELARA
jgi:amidase